MSSADTEDVGGDFASEHAFQEVMLRATGIQEDRQRRLRALAGKFVVTTKGRSTGKRVFFQDQNVSSGGYWTQFLSNALGYTDIGQAKLLASGFNYNDPKVAVVGHNGQYTILD